METFDVICRTCNRQKSHLINLSSKAFENNSFSLLEVLLIVCPNISVQEPDRLPQSICHYCLRKLKKAYIFQLQCKKACEELSQMLEATPKHVSYLRKKNEESYDIQDKLCIEKVNYDSLTSLSEDLEILEDHYDLEDDVKESTERVHEAETIIQKPVEYTNLLSNKNEPPIMCCHCDKKFFTTRGLLFHEKLTHKNLKPILTNAEILTIECKYCLQVFERQIELTLHCRTEHRNELAKDLTCTTCQKTFSDKNRYEHHLLYHAKSRFQCSVKGCSRTFVIKYKLTDHLKRFHGVTLSPSQIRAIKPLTTKS